MNLTHQPFEPFGPKKPIPTVAVVVLNNGMMSSSSSTWPWSLLGQLKLASVGKFNEPNDSTRKNMASKRKNWNFAKQNGDSGLVEQREISPAICDLEKNQVMGFKIIVYI